MNDKNKKIEEEEEEEKEERDYINIKQYRRVESSCNRAFSPKEYRVERYTTKPKLCYHVHDSIYPEKEIILNQSQFDAYVESERMKRYYEKEEDRLEKFEKALYKRISNKIKHDQVKMSCFIEKEMDEMKRRCNCTKKKSYNN